jgi:hypothetical protein
MLRRKEIKLKKRLQRNLSIRFLIKRKLRRKPRVAMSKPVFRKNNYGLRNFNKVNKAQKTWRPRYITTPFGYYFFYKSYKD